MPGVAPSVQVPLVGRVVEAERAVDVLEAAGAVTDLGVGVEVREQERRAVEVGAEVDPPCQCPGRAAVERAAQASSQPPSARPFAQSIRQPKSIADRPWRSPM